MPKVSIILTTHDGRKSVCRKAIQSVLDQTFTDFELIIVDDASKDGTDKMVYELMDIDRKNHPERIVYVKRTRNFGNHSQPKNDGIKEAQGEYICFLDSDNTYRKNHIEALYNALQMHPEIDVVYGDRLVHDELNRTKAIGIFSDFNPGLLMQRNYIDTSDTMIKKNVLFYVGGWDERFKRFLDWNLNLRMLKAGYKFMRVPEVLTDYRVHKKMLSYEVENRENPGEPLWSPYDCEIRLPYLDTIPEPRIAIFTLTKDRLEYTKKSFSSMRKTAGLKFDHYIYDNGSTDGTVQWLKEYQKANEGVHVEFSPDNKGISIASNNLLDEMQEKYDIIMKSDNDAFYETEGWLKTMVKIWKSNHMLALSCYVSGLRDNPGGSERLGQAMICNELVGVVRHLGGICHFVDARAYRNFRWDENSTLHGFQDMEMSKYLRESGYQQMYLENFYVSHGNGTSEQEKEYPEYFEKRRKEKQTIYEN